MNVGIVGGGLFGSVIAKALLNDGHEVTIFDDDRQYSGSLPSGGLMKPSWFAGLGPNVHEPAMRLLNELYKIEEIPFNVKVGPLKFRTDKVFRISTQQIKAEMAERIGIIAKKVIAYKDNGVLELASRAIVAFDFVIISAGAWTDELYPCEMRKLQGVSFMFEGTLSPGIIAPWAPYKQLVAFQFGSQRIWAGDGSAILAKNWTDARTRQCQERLEKILPGREIKNAFFGYRPYVESRKPCLFQRVDNQCIVATGGAKNGTILAGWVASQIREELA